MDNTELVASKQKELAETIGQDAKLAKVAIASFVTAFELLRPVEEE